MASSFRLRNAHKTERCLSMEPKKSSFLVNKYKGPSRKLLFNRPAQMPIVDRDYGLIKVTADKASTPFPRASEGIDISTLRARLEKERTSKIKVDPSEKSDSPISNLHFMSTPRRPHVMHPERMPSGTPHPTKGTAVNPKLLKKQIGAIDWDAKMSHQWASIRRLSDIQSILTEMDIGRKSVRSLLSVHGSRYKHKTPPSCLRKDMSGKSSATELKHKCKKVTIISPRRSMTSEMGGEKKTSLMDQRSSTVISSVPKSQLLSFKERRKLFYEGEFTIAKNGKKMSEQFMTEQANQFVTDEGTVREDKRATDAIEMFIRKQGFIKAPAGTLTGTTKIKLNESASINSMSSNPSGYTFTRKSGNYPNTLHSTPPQKDTAFDK